MMFFACKPFVQPDQGVCEDIDFPQRFMRVDILDCRQIKYSYTKRQLEKLAQAPGGKEIIENSNECIMIYQNIYLDKKDIKDYRVDVNTQLLPNVKDRNGPADINMMNIRYCVLIFQDNSAMNVFQQCEYLIGKISDTDKEKLK